MAQKVPWTIHRPDDKAKNVLESLKWTLHKRQYFKHSNKNIAPVFGHLKKKTIEFRDSTHAIYWPAKIVLKNRRYWK